MHEIRLETERLVLRNWGEKDRALFHLINSDERVMEHFPFRRDRAFTDRIMDEIVEQNERRGFGFFAIALKETDEAIGFASLSNADAEGTPVDGLPEIGWRLAPHFWGHGYATEAAARMVRLGFEDFAVPEIVSFAVPANTKSIAVMERLGMQRDEARDFDHPRVADTHPHLKRHHVYFLKNPTKKGA